ncbi:MFS transporter [Chamaesiphon sp. VAR_48_metabat_135_sub]|uniref:MFS transporter n=1 Tax=Chamaesiphon sp. VAR_48_metabat_135_sub TaxID=2964699 RepID=UPI00286B54F3|nr:MFS transporter [Chamaesiphon sp. VAR_48_metabat_135_sub]
MLPYLDFIQGSSGQLLHLAQFNSELGGAIVENFSSPQFLVALLSGLLMAIAFQLLLTNLSVALIASPGVVPESGDDSDSLMDTVRGIETKIGIGAMVTMTISLAAACFLAVKLSLTTSVFVGAIVGVTIWSAYFSLVVLLGANAVGSLIGSIVSTASSGLQGMMGTATTALGANAAKNQVVSTAEEITAAVRRELTSGLDAGSIQKTLQSSLSNLQLPNLDVDKIGSQFEKLLKESDLKDIANSDLLGNINRQSFVDLVSNRTDFSKKDINQIADKLETTWKQLVGKEGGQKDVPSQLRELLKSATPEDLNSDELTGKVQQLIKGVDLKDGNGGSFTSQALQFGLSALLSKVVQNTDLSDLDVEKVSGQINKLKASVLGGSEQSEAQESDTKTKPFSVIRADLENYLLFSPAWELNQTAVKKEFKDVVYDPQADSATIRQELEQIDRQYFVETLSLRDDLKPGSIENLSNYLEEVRSEVVNSTQTNESESQSPDLQKAATELRTKVETYLRDTNKEELNPEGIQRDLQALFEDPKAGISALKELLGQFVGEASQNETRDTVVQLLSQRQDLDEGQINEILDRVESVKTSVLEAPQQVTEQAKAQYEKTTAALTEYLRKTNLEELDPEGIKKDLQTLLDDPKAGADALRDRLSQVDRDTLVKLLTQQGNLTEEQVNATVDRVQSAIGSLASLPEVIVKAPRRLANRAQKQAVDFEASLENYLRNTEKEELNPDGIKRDLQLLLKHPTAGFDSLGDRISHFDRSTFIALLSQREDMSEEEANRIADQVESTYKSLTEQIQKVKQTFQSAIDNIFGKVRDYLNALERPELNYEGIQADFSKIFDDPQAGFEALGERLGHFDKETLVAVLSSREDISEEDANRIIAKIEDTRNTVMERGQRIQQEVQKRFKAVKKQAREQAIEAQKMAASAAWWLFGTALTSLVASAIAGMMAINGVGAL